MTTWQAIGSGGPYALAAARGLRANTQMSPAESPSGESLCGCLFCLRVFTNDQINVEELRKGVDMMSELTPRGGSSLSWTKYIVGQREAKRAVAIACEPVTVGR